MKYTIHNKEVVYQSFFQMVRYELSHELFGGGQSDLFAREVLNRGDAVAVLLHDPSKEKVVLVEQFRVGAIESDNPWVTELVAGIVESGEESEEVAFREAQEESGLNVRNLLSIAGPFYNSVGGSSETTHLFYGLVDTALITSDINGLDHENEDIRLVVMDERDFFSELTANRFRSASLLLAGYWLKDRLN